MVESQTHLRLQLEIVQVDVSLFAIVGHRQDVDHVRKALGLVSLAYAIDHFL